jgi:hypothetical protein
VFNLFSVKSFTRSGLTLFAYHSVCVFGADAHFASTPIIICGIIDLIGWSNALGLRNAIARERGITAYKAWLPFERIRPASIPQSQWEEAFAWPPDNGPPYPTLANRVLRTAASYLLLFAIMAVLLQVLTPFPLITWLSDATRGSSPNLGVG